MIGIDFEQRRWDVDNAMLDLYNHLMNTKIAAEMLNIMEALNCVVTIVSDKPTGKVYSSLIYLMN